VLNSHSKGCSYTSRCRTLLVQAVEGHWQRALRLVFARRCSRALGHSWVGSQACAQPQHALLPTFHAAGLTAPEHCRHCAGFLCLRRSAGRAESVHAQPGASPTATDRASARTSHFPARLPAWLICMHTRSSRLGPARRRGDIYYPAGLTRVYHGWPSGCLFTRRWGDQYVPPVGRRTLMCVRGARTAGFVVCPALGTFRIGHSE
jgi:hypothetical protein